MEETRSPERIIFNGAEDGEAGEAVQAGIVLRSGAQTCVVQSVFPYRWEAMNDLPERLK